MARLPKKTIQKLAVLYALTLWKKGACGAVRGHKTLFFAEKERPRHLFTFKRYHLGQYSKEIDGILNSLQEAGRLKVHFDGAAARLEPKLSADAKDRIESLFAAHCPEWLQGLNSSVNEFGYLKSDELLRRAHEDDSYTENDHDDIIHESSLGNAVDLPDVNSDLAERLSDLVDEQLMNAISDNFKKALRNDQTGMNWRVLFEDNDE